MKRVKIVFSECEHDGDLENYKDDLRSSGATILESAVNPDEEEGWVKIEVEDWDIFQINFMKTDSYLFSNLSQG